jgi:hypothetical protein
MGKKREKQTVLTVLLRLDNQDSEQQKAEAPWVYQFQPTYNYDFWHLCLKQLRTEAIH